MMQLSLNLRLPLGWWGEGDGGYWGCIDIDVNKTNVISMSWILLSFTL